MSIEVTEKSGEIVVKINGDNYEDLKKAQGRWNFKEVESLIEYAFNIVVLHDGSWVYLLINGKELKYWPNPQLLKNKENEDMDEISGDDDNIVSFEDNVFSFKEYLSSLKDDE